MVKRVSVAHAKAQLSSIASEVAFGGPHVIIERRSKPWVALVRISDLEYLEQVQPTSETPLGALALAGAWREADDADMEALVEKIYAERDNDLGRPVEIDA
ncbi:MAG: type II toxin-antitoxin system Phd/YefM family antitoxin [Dehalococcoidia bacterium]|nr:type II toxin-antitoxin system Phd/YefM family antitoxin [Dehalococcoidia bacterium]